MPITNRIGPPVEGQDFYGREKELATANRLLDSGNSLLLAAPRRIGKSSFAKKLITQKSNEGWKCVYIDLEETQNETEFLELLLSAIEEKNLWADVASTSVKALKGALVRIKSLKIGPVTLNVDQSQDGDNIYQGLKNAINHKTKSLIVIDELTLFLNCLQRQEQGEEKIRFILNWLRSLRQVSGTQVRWLFAGSVGLNNFTQLHGLSYSINDLTNFHLGELDEIEARGLLKSLAESSELNMKDDIINYTVDKLSWNIPYFIQLVIWQLILLWKEGELSRNDIDMVYSSLSNSEYLSTWSERLVEFPNEMDARKILDQLSISPEGTSTALLISIYQQGHKNLSVDECNHKARKLLNMLDNDGYIMNSSGKWTFRSPLLRDYWKNKFCI